ncbi:hypothetical protein H312_02177 [Anncaliia algerae PRA339]|uniref:Tr-type G domain-containing protein n=1 Tax=Anncaliia algerae PRA339 TaxID=1288291 RepID=A0A059F085_9MICR|nr:hypothetical protein H312_02177 [Anncaliia algerae PRA339]
MTIITSVVAHIDHGKTTLLDSLLAYTKTISPISAGELRYLDSRGDEQTRGITLKLSALNIPDVQMTFLDTPGHIDLHHNIMESNSLVDTSILLVDVNEGITPRIFSLISNKPTILFLNKIDKLFDLSLEDVVFRLEQILCKIQAMFDDKFINHDNYFEWNKNNIIIGSTKYTFAVNYTSFSVFKKNSTIKSLIYFIFKIKEAIDSNSCIKIFNEYKIKNINTKEVFTSLFPLHKTLFQSNKCIYKEKHSNFTQALTSYSVCHNDKVLFITRIFGGKISKDDFMLCFNHRDVSIEKVKGIYIFKNERLEEVSEVSGDNLVALEGNFFKKCNFFNLMELIKLHNNYAMNDKIEYFINENAQEINDLPIKLLENKIKALKSIDLNDSVVNFIAKFMLYNYKRACEERIPFYSKILLVNNLNELNLFKDLFRKIYQTESCIKVILNKYNEFEINTQGRVHLEKVLYDFDALYSKSEVVSDIKLINFGTGYTLIDKEGSFAECSTIYSKFENEDVFLEVIPSENEECLCVSNNELSESILINFINNGLLI